MAQPQLPSVTVELADFVTTSCANRTFLRALDRDDDLPLAQFGLENADFGQTQMWGIPRELQKSRIQSVMRRKICLHSDIWLSTC